MTSIDPSTTIAALAVERPQRTRIFEQLGLDYCCGGGRTLESACAADGLDLHTVLVLLEHEAEAQAPAASDTDWASASVDELVDHIVRDHHGYLRSELPRLSELSAKVRSAHGDERPELIEVAAIFERLRAELDEHAEKEERDVFPAARLLAAGSAPHPAAPALDELEHEHAEVGAALAELRSLTGGYDVERSLCRSHRALIDGLRELELDIHEHVHEENNILFPRLVAAAAPAAR